PAESVQRIVDRIEQTLASNTGQLRIGDVSCASGRPSERPSRKRVAVLGLYNSGSTAVAGMLHRLGVNMGAPFWQENADNSPRNFYEPSDLAWQLRTWWNEPRLATQAPAGQRIEFLRQWIVLQECARPSPAGAKHPLLSLCGEDLLAAWGDDVVFIWSWRPLAESIAGLKRRGWFPGMEEAMQTKLWESLGEFESRAGRIERIDWREVQADPVGTAQRLADLAGLAASPSYVDAAAQFIRTDKEK
ncbi:MAG: hypothetical protein KDA41_11140, partial [Planctomycetales bacterium]|nr:hypothetical protein [Planctomycetales bacterium]